MVELLLPSPKFHDHELIVPKVIVELFVNLTESLMQFPMKVNEGTGAGFTFIVLVMESLQLVPLETIRLTEYVPLAV